VRLSLALLGGFEITLDGERVTSFGSNKVRALLAYLVVEADRAHRRESLSALLWPGFPDRSARTNLRNALYNLRIVIGDREAELPFLHISRATLQFNIESDHQLDVRQLDKAHKLADQVPVEHLTKAANLYTGDFLAGFTLEDAVGFDDWVSVTQERLRRQVLDLLGVLIDRLVVEEDFSRALTYARRRVELEPWLEEAQRQLIRLLAATGQRSAALRQYRRCVRVLEDELGAQPAVETQALYDEIRTTGHTDRPRVDILPITPVPSPPATQRPAFLDEDMEPVVTERPVFVSREPELTRLEGYLDAALAGHGQD
jgi:DNA-binding SARP family transcriptional activator